MKMNTYVDGQFLPFHGSTKRYFDIQEHQILIELTVISLEYMENKTLGLKFLHLQIMQNFRQKFWSFIVIFYY